ncbi:hypothetical protein [Burkholderia gladioli]
MISARLEGMPVLVEHAGLAAYRDRLGMSLAGEFGEEGVEFHAGLPGSARSRGIPERYARRRAAAAICHACLHPVTGLGRQF